MLHFVCVLFVCFIIAALVQALGWKAFFQLALLLILGITAMFLVWLTGMALLAWLTWDFAISILGIFGIAL